MVFTNNYNNNYYLTHVTELMNETEFGLEEVLMCSLTFDVPSAYCEHSLHMWNNELDRSRELYEQQHALANSRMKKKEFETMDALLRQSRDFVTSQRFHEVMMWVRVYD